MPNPKRSSSPRSYVTEIFPWLGFRSFNFGTVAATANSSTLILQCAPLQCASPPGVQTHAQFGRYVIDVEGTVHDTVTIPAKF